MKNRDEFDRLLQKPEYAAAVKSLGFVSGAEKSRALREADLFCFPTQYLGENQPVSLIEAMAFGLPIVTTRWRSLPEMLPPGYPGLVNGQDPDEIATALLHMARGRKQRNSPRRFFSTASRRNNIFAAWPPPSAASKHLNALRNRASADILFSLKIGLLQLNSTVGDFAANRQKLLAGYEKAVALGAEFVLAPELFLCGYPPRDLLLRDDFIDGQSRRARRNGTGHRRGSALRRLMSRKTPNVPAAR